MSKNHVELQINSIAQQKRYHTLIDSVYLNFCYYQIISLAVCKK